MKLIKLDNSIVIYIKKETIKGYDILKKDLIESYFENLFIILKDNYHLNINGFYNIDIYTDLNYGMIIVMQKEDVDYYDYYSNTIDMQIVTHSDGYFLYEILNINFIDDNLLPKVITYKYKNKLYFKIIKNIDSISLGKLIENSNIIYGERVKKVIKKAIPLDISMINCL